jgi:polyketide cyclase/dehydrase/lipid transport protein
MTVTDPSAAYCLARIGKTRPGWDTLVVSGAASTTAGAPDLWAVWADLERWPRWSPLHRSVSWTGPARLAEGATFDQQLSLGFPVGTTTEHVTLAMVEPGQRAAWAGDSNGIRSCHLWSFTPLPGGGTQVSNVEAFTGLPIALVRPLAAGRWNRDFQGAVDGLIRQVTQANGAVAN